MKLAGVVIVSEAEVIGRDNLENLSRGTVEFFFNSENNVHRFSIHLGFYLVSA